MNANPYKSYLQLIGEFYAFIVKQICSYNDMHIHMQYNESP